MDLRGKWAPKMQKADWTEGCALGLCCLLCLANGGFGRLDGHKISKKCDARGATSDSVSAGIFFLPVMLNEMELWGWSEYCGTIAFQALVLMLLYTRVPGGCPGNQFWILNSDI